MNEIVLQGFNSPTLANDFLDLRKTAIFKSSKITCVKSLPGEEMALEALTELQRLERGVEKTRKEVKSKPFDLCKQIDALAASAVEPLETETKRVKGLLGQYAEIKRQEALEEERKRQEEIRKIEEARRVEEAKIAAAARAQAEELERVRQMELQAANAKTAKAREEASKLAREAQAKADEEARKLAEAAQSAQHKEGAIRESVPVVAPRATGASTKFILRYRVTDINELFANYPHVCEITEKKSAVNMLINGLQMANPNDLPKCKGLEIWREADVNSRTR